MHHCTIAPFEPPCKHHLHRRRFRAYGVFMDAKSDPLVRKTVSLPTSMWKEIEDFQFANRVKRDSEAIRRLIEAGLKAAKSGKD